MLASGNLIVKLINRKSYQEVTETRETLPKLPKKEKKRHSKLSLNHVQDINGFV